MPDSSVEKQTPDSSEETIPPTNGQEDHHTDTGEDFTAYVSRLESRFAAQQVENRRMQKRLEEVENRKPEPPPTPRDVEAENRKYYTDPIPVLDEREQKLEDRLMARIEKSLAPIKAVAQRINATDEYAELKREVASDPVFGKAMKDPDVMAVVDRMMSTPNASMDTATLKMAISSVSFSKQNGLLPGVSRGNNNNQNDSTRNADTAYLPPSNRRREPAPQKRELTEDDRLAMRIGGITDEAEYFKLIEDDVMVLPSDKPREKQGRK